MKKYTNDLIVGWENGEICFCGKQISEYGLQHGFVDYATLSQAVGAMILNNDIINFDFDNWETTNGSLYETETIYYDEDYNEIDEDEAEELRKQGREVIEEENDGDYREFYQYYIITANGADFLERFTNETILYNEKLDVYLWAIDHFGTGWSCVLTEIEIKEVEENETTQDN